MFEQWEGEGDSRRKVQVVNLKWSAIRPLDDALADLEKHDGPGLYAVHGWHPVSGPNTLMYLGMSTSSVRARLCDHAEGWVHELQPPAAHYAVTRGVNADALEAIEALMISWHFPPYNSQHASGLGSQGHWRIYNTGYYAGLIPVLCTDWWPHHSGQLRPPPAPSDNARVPRMDGVADVVGVDSCPKGWIALRAVDGQIQGGGVYATFAEVLDAFATAAVIAVDIPIGLPPPYPRPADALARKFVGAKRRNSVFPTPHRVALDAGSYEEAARLCREQTGRALSTQAFAILPKIREVQSHAFRDRRVVEVHPEVSFRAMADSDLEHYKKAPEGRALREALLERHGLVVPSDLDLRGAARDDVLDAAAALWSAARLAAGTARSLPETPAPGEDGYPAAIWY